MKKSTYMKLLLPVFVSMLFVSGASAHAEVGATTSVKANVGLGLGTRCVAVNAKIDARTSTFQARHDAYVKLYADNKVKLQNVITELKAQGKSTTKIEADLAALNLKVNAFATDAQTVQDKLNATKQFTCGNSAGDFKATLKAAEEARKVAVKDAMEIRAYVRNTVKVDVMAAAAISAKI